MTSVNLESLLTIIYVLVDDWYKAEGYKLLAGKVGSKPMFTDSEMLTLMLAHEFVPYPGETQYVGYMRANYLHLFPKLVDQSQYNRRSRGLSGKDIFFGKTHSNLGMSNNPKLNSAENARRSTHTGIKAPQRAVA